MDFQQQQQNYPSFQKLETRSTSFPHQRLTDLYGNNPRYRPPHIRNNLFYNVDEEEYHGLSSSSNHHIPQGPFLMDPLDSFTIPSSPQRPGIERRKRPLLIKRTPILTMALVKLDENLNKFCDYLKDPTYSNVQIACAVLDTTVATATATTSTSPSGSSGRLSPYSSPSSPQRNLSPNLSPLSNFFTGSPILGRNKRNNNNSDFTSSSSAIALEGEWEKFCNPLIVFACCECMYNALSHVESTSLANNICQLYQKTIQDIQLVKETLCDPFLITISPTKNKEDDNDQNNNNENDIPSLPTKNPIVDDSLSPSQKSTSILEQHKEKATTVGTSLGAIILICQYRCKLIDQHRKLWLAIDKAGISYTTISSTFQTILPQKTIVDKSGHAKTILLSVAQEIEAWYHMMEMIIAMGQCRFMPSIINAQKIKLNLNLSSSTCLQLWMKRSWQSLLSILSIIFDRVSSATDTMYGFQKTDFAGKSSSSSSNLHKRLGPSQDLNSKVEEFLHSEEKIGSPLAIAVVFDATKRLERNNTLNLNLERGYFSGDHHSSLKQNTNVPLEVQTALATFPAIYMRSTIHPKASPVSAGRRRGDKKKVEDDKQSVHENQKAENVESSVNSLFYTSWPSLIPLLGISAKSLNRSGDVLWLQANDEISLFTVPINDSMWLVTMMKTSIADVLEYRWNRRRSVQPSTKLVEEEVQEFVEEFATLLKFDEIFKPSHVRDIRKSEMNSGSIPIDFGKKLQLQEKLVDHQSPFFIGGNNNDNEDNYLIDLIQSFKEELGLRSPRCKETLQSSYYGLRFGGGTGKIRKSPAFSKQDFRSRTAKLSSSQESSHLAFFMGNQLMNAL